MTDESSRTVPLPSAEPLRGAHVLVVEDSDISREIASELLSGLGCRVTLAVHGAEALGHLDHHRFDAVLMDLQMPVMDGLETTRRIRQDARYGALPIIAISATQTTGDIVRCLAAGMSDHIGKPLDLAVLTATLTKWLGPALEASPADEAAARTRSRELPASLAGVDLAQGLRNMAGNPVLYRKMLLKFLDTQADMPERIRAALWERDRPTARRHVHTLTGVAGSIGARDLQLAAIALGDSIRQDRPDVAQRLKSVIEASAHLLDAIVSMRDPSAPMPAAVDCRPDPADSARLRGVLTELRRRLAEDDTSAAELIEALVAGRAQSGHDERIAAIDSAFGRYEFDEAIAAVDDLLSELEFD